MPDAAPGGWRIAGNTRPDHLALTSWLHCGPLPPPSPFHCLQIGRDSARNLIALAFYNPEATFVGFETTTDAAERGRAAAASLTLDNLSFAAVADDQLAAALAGRPPFDYILVQDRFSQASDDERGATLDLCREAVSRQGVIAVDFDVYPGAAFRPVIKAALGPRAGDAGPAERVRLARERASNLRRYLGVVGADLVGDGWRGELGAFLEASDELVLERYLDAVARPLPFGEFVQLAASRGLRYLAEATFARAMFVPPGELLAVMEEDGLETEEREHLLDAISMRRQRHGLLCRADSPMSNGPSPQMLESIRVASYLAPAPGEISLEPNVPLEFRTPEGRTLNTDDGFLKTMLVLLARQQPASLKVGELLDSAKQILTDAGYNLRLAGGWRADFCAGLLRFHRDGVVELRLVDRLPPEPTLHRLHELARFELGIGNDLTTPMHTLLHLDPLGRRTATLLDGERSSDEVVAILSREVKDGGLTLLQHGLPVTNPARSKPILQQLVAAHLATLGSWGLLAGEAPDRVADSPRA